MEKKNGKTVGSVMVVGGGVGGVQASLDLADAGYKVYLVESKPSIGGLMAQLDKTFPTNDCSMCILAPKLVDAGSHPNIRILASSELTALEGEPGAFKARVLRHSRYIDETKCTGCGECATVCPVNLPSLFNAGLGKRKASDRLYPQAVPNSFSITKTGRALCSAGCPIDSSIQAYVALIGAGKFREAAAVIRKDNPLPSICGRVCFHPCENNCNRGKLDESVNIRALKRYAIDLYPEGDMPEEEIVPTGKSVAIIGSGPAGLAAAHSLALSGHKVTIYESLPVLGGMLSVGIPDYRLPTDILERDLAYIRKLGVEFRNNTSIGETVPASEIEKTHDAVFLATGAHKSKKLDIPGEDIDGVVHGVDFLRKHTLGQPTGMGKNVVIIGGGNTAIDAARTAVRLGADKVTLVYRRSRKEMPADPLEVDAAIEEGVVMHFLAAPVRVIADENGRMKSVECVRMELGEPDSSGRRRPVTVEGSEFEVPADTLIPAVSQSPDDRLAKEFGLETTRWGTIETDELTMATKRNGFFAGGDVVLGPSSVIEAIAHGKTAAKAIHNFLSGKPVNEGIEKRPEGHNPISEEELRDIKEKTPRLGRIRPKELEAHERLTGFMEVEAAYTEEEAVREALRCLNCAQCCECFQCVEVCQAKAIDHCMKDRIEELDVGAVILSPGIETFRAELKEEYGLGVFPNVVTAIQFERILCASGPSGGHVARESDHKEPKKIAFLQCVGSRDTRCDREYCSSVCCTYATKEAILAKEHCPGAEISIFGMDFRTHGKDFEKFMLRAQAESGVRYVKTRVPAVDEDPETHNLILTYENEKGEQVEEEFDMVVLSVGLDVSKEARELAERLGIQLDEYGFARTSEKSPLVTSREGVFVCGAFEAPKDIPETVMQASAAAAAAAATLRDSRNTLVTKKQYPDERDVRFEEPRIGVFVCSCGSNIAGVVNVARVTEAAKDFENVELAENLLYTCSQDALNKIKERIDEHNLNRIVVASCSPRTHEKLFQENIREVGLNRYLFEMANIRDHCSWVHRDNPEAATIKSMDLVRSAVAKVRLSEPLETHFFEIVKAGLVIGGGVAGMNAALSLAEQGFEVHLVEKESKLGGLSLRIHETMEGLNVSEYLDYLAKKVADNPLITVHLSSRVTAVEGSIGHFRSTVKTENGGERQIETGTIIVATGGRELESDEYGRGKHPGVLTQMEFEERVTQDHDLGSLDNVVMIQCVGSRTEEYPNCSRICCAEAIKNAIAFKEKRPEANVLVLYRDIRTYGTMEKYYRIAREKGVVFVRYELQNPPRVGTDGSLSVTFHDPILQRHIEMPADAVVLSVGARPNRDNAATAPMLKVPLTEDGWFFEAHVKLRPVDFATDGIFVCGMAHGPKLIKESAVQGLAAASRAATILSQDKMEALSIVSRVDPAICSGCKLCNTLCAYDAISFDEEKGVSVINANVCKGCGTCAANCISGAITQLNFRDDQIHDQIAAIPGGREAAGSDGQFEPKVLAFLCNWCSYAGADLAGISRSQYPPNVRVIRVMCSGRVSPLFVIKALEEGFDGVWISGCHPGDCHYIEGNFHARRRWMAFRELLENAGVDMRRVTFSWISASENRKFADTAAEIVEKIKKLGPNKRFRDISPTEVDEPVYY